MLVDVEQTASRDKVVDLSEEPQEKAERSVSPKGDLSNFWAAGWSM